MSEFHAYSLSGGQGELRPSLLFDLNKEKETFIGVGLHVADAKRTGGVFHSDTETRANKFLNTHLKVIK